MNRFHGSTVDFLIIILAPKCHFSINLYIARQATGGEKHFDYIPAINLRALTNFLSINTIRMT